MKIDFFADQTQFVDHLAPVYAALGDNAGEFYILPIDELAEYVASLGIKPTVLEQKSFGADTLNELIQQQQPMWGMTLPINGRPVVAACTGAASAVSPYDDRPMAYLEHGCGMTFLQDSATHGHPGGGGKRDRFSLFLMPNCQVSRTEKAAHPTAKVVTVGCPKLDRWHGYEAKKSRRKKPVVAMVFHWDAHTVPETRNTWDEYQDIIPELTKHFKVIGHAHPREWDKFSKRFAALGVKAVKDFDDVCEQADLLCGDSGSAPYEFAAATGKPVVLRNASYYRRAVNHGLRFWQKIPGMECDDQEDLVDTIKAALLDPEHVQNRRNLAVKAAYSYLDGQCANRAAGVILDWAKGQA